MEATTTTLLQKLEEYRKYICAVTGFIDARVCRIENHSMLASMSEIVYNIGNVLYIGGYS